MSKLSEATWKVITAFTKAVKGDSSESEIFSASEIKRADEELGWRDEGSSYRLAMKNRIKDLEHHEEKSESRKEQSHIRIWQLVTGILAALLVGLVLAWLA